MVINNNAMSYTHGVLKLQHNLFYVTSQLIDGKWMNGNVNILKSVLIVMLSTMLLLEFEIVFIFYFFHFLHYFSLDKRWIFVNVRNDIYLLHQCGPTSSTMLWMWLSTANSLSTTAIQICHSWRDTLLYLEGHL